MSTTTKLITVAEYEAMVDSGDITPSDRLVLIEGRLVKKMTKYPSHTLSTPLLAPTDHRRLRCLSLLGVGH